MKTLSIMIAFTLPSIVMAQKQIPGITAVDIYGNYTKIGFELDRKFAAGGNLWTCKMSNEENTLMVEVYGKGTDFVISSRASIQGEMTAEAIRFLAFSSTIDYEGSQPEQAKEWVKAHMNGGTTTIGRVRFTVKAPSGSVRILLMEAI